MPQAFSETIQVASYECDFQSRMTPGAILRRVQQISLDHCASLGMDDAFFVRTATAFLLSRLTLTVFSPIAVEKNIRIETVPYCSERLIYPRRTVLFEGGVPLAQVDAQWFLFDTAQRKILRSAPEGYPYRFPEKNPVPMKCEIIRAAQTAPVGEYTAVYSRCDRNRHLNNAVYADCLCDLLSDSLFAGKKMRRLDICYHAELSAGSSMTLYHGNTEKGHYFFGASPQEKHFEASVILE